MLFTKTTETVSSLRLSLGRTLWNNSLLYHSGCIPICTMNYTVLHLQAIQTCLYSILRLSATCFFLLFICELESKSLLVWFDYSDPDMVSSGKVTVWFLCSAFLLTWALKALYTTCLIHLPLLHPPLFYTATYQQQTDVNLVTKFKLGTKLKADGSLPTLCNTCNNRQ